MKVCTWEGSSVKVCTWEGSSVKVCTWEGSSVKVCTWEKCYNAYPHLSVHISINPNVHVCTE